MKLIELIDQREWEGVAQRVASHPKEIGEEVLLPRRHGASAYKTTCLFEACRVFGVLEHVPWNVLELMLRQDRLYCEGNEERELAACRMIGTFLFGTAFPYPLWVFIGEKLRSHSFCRRHVVEAYRLFAQFAPECLTKTNEDGWTILHATLVWSRGCRAGHHSDDDGGARQACRILLEGDPSLRFFSKYGNGKIALCNSPLHALLGRRRCFDEDSGPVADMLLPPGSGSLLHRIARFPLHMELHHFRRFSREGLYKDSTKYERALLEADGDGNLPLHIALMERKWILAKFFCVSEAAQESVSTKNNEGICPLELAMNLNAPVELIINLIRCCPVALQRLRWNDSLFPCLCRHLDSSLVFQIIQGRPSLVPASDGRIFQLVSNERGVGRSTESLNEIATS